MTFKRSHNLDYSVMGNGFRVKPKRSISLGNCIQVFDIFWAEFGFHEFWGCNDFSTLRIVACVLAEKSVRSIHSA